MACYLPDHLVRCSICKHFFSDARRLRCGCVYCYQCCLTLVDDYTLRCRCSVEHRFKSSDDLVKVNRNHTQRDSRISEKNLTRMRISPSSSMNWMTRRSLTEAVMRKRGYRIAEAARLCSGILSDKQKSSSWCSAMPMIASFSPLVKDQIHHLCCRLWSLIQWSMISFVNVRNKIK